MESLAQAIGCEDLLAAAREEIERLTPAETLAAVERGAILVDIRPGEQPSSSGPPDRRLSVMPSAYPAGD